MAKKYYAKNKRKAPPAPPPADLVFALDIGTRSVVGILARQEEDAFHILDYEQMEHPSRAMTDGQVEDIKAVGALIGKVKHRLEERNRVTLSNVAVAAAGRALKTVRTRLDRAVPDESAIDADFVLGMESEAIEQAQQSIQNSDAPLSMRFYFVGYSIVQYAMDGHSVASLVGHTCTNAAVELIAAFLPYSVIESLYAAVETCALTVTSLTLEPIAAMNLLIPPELRLLNLALVDIGAGTSDVAVCRDGAVFAYDMATVAGDEITEAVIRACLVNFETAERIKRALCTSDESVSYDDVLGLACTRPRTEILSAIDDSIDSLAKIIAERILACNGDVPAAVFLVGGGSQIPGLGKKLSAHLGLDESKISAGVSRTLRGVKTEFPALSSPEYITPIGIGMTSMHQQSFQFWGVTVNGKPLKLLISREMRMIDMLLMAGFQTSQILGRAGRSLTYTLNGETFTRKGGLPEHARLTVNEAEANVDTLVYPGDAITFIPAVHGEDAAATLHEVAGVPLQAAGRVTLCGGVHRIGVWADVNGTPQDSDIPLRQGDAVTIHAIYTLKELCDACQMDMEVAELIADGVPLAPSTVLRDGMVITLPARQSPAAPVLPEASALPVAAPAQAPDIPPAPAAAKPEPIPEPIPEPAPEPVFIAPQPAPEPVGQEPEPASIEPPPKPVLALTLNGETVELPLDGAHSHYYVMNLLGRCGLDLKKPQGAIRIKVNGSDAAFSQMLHQNDIVEIGWA